jgi:hypothetical protein
MKSPFFVDYPGSRRATDYQVRRALETENTRPLTVLQAAVLLGLVKAGGLARDDIHLRTIAGVAGYHGPAEQVARDLLNKRKVMLWHHSWLAVGLTEVALTELIGTLSAERDEAVSRAFAMTQAYEGSAAGRSDSLVQMATALGPNLEATVAGRPVVGLGALRVVAHKLQERAGQCRVALDKACDRAELIAYLEGDYRTHHMARGEQ